MSKKESVLQALGDKLQNGIALIDVIENFGGRVESKDNLRITECPYHYPKGAKTVVIDVQENKFHCTDCKFKGGVIAWVMNYQGLEYVEAMVYLADYKDFTIDETYFGEEVSLAKKKRDKVLKRLTGQYCAALQASQEGLEYVGSKRQLNKESIETFNIGWCGKQISSATPLNRSLWRYGVLGRLRDGKYFNKLTHRITFPIKDEEGLIRGFGGRSISDNHEVPKYINSAASHYFRKKEILYGLYETLQHQRAPDRVILVEGYLDVVSLHQHGFKCAVAPLGTAINATQIYTALLYTEHISICFDINKAGSDATLSAICKSFDVTDGGHKIDVVRMPEGYDPDEYIREFGADSFNELLRTAQPAEDWLAHRALQESIALRRTSRSNGDKAQPGDMENDFKDVSTNARVGQFINELSDSFASAAVKKKFTSAVERQIGTKL